MVSCVEGGFSWDTAGPLRNQSGSNQGHQTSQALDEGRQ
jgi:hypothetical protein